MRASVATLSKGHRQTATERELKRNQVVSPCSLFTLVTIWSLVGHSLPKSVFRARSALPLSFLGDVGPRPEWTEGLFSDRSRQRHPMLPRTQGSAGSKMLPRAW